MVKCPVCLSDQVVFVAGPRTTSCHYCGAQWVQDAGQQTAIDRSNLHLATAPASAGAAAS
jgi:ribosomal protein S27E